MIKTVYFHAIGCAENLLDAQKYYDFLTLNGFKIVDAIEDADVIIFFTCGVTSYVSDECLEIYDKLVKNRKYSAKIFVGGCLPIIEKAKMNKNDSTVFYSAQGDITTLARVLDMKEYVWNENKYGHEFYRGIGNKEREKGAVSKPEGILEKLVYFEKSLDSINVTLEIQKSTYFQYITEDYYNNAFFVHVARGCCGECTYCAIKFVKGYVKSKSIQDIVKEVKQGVELGHTDIILAGDDLSSYGKDLNCDFYELMEELINIQGNINYTVRNFEPFWLLQNKKKMEHILTSGKIRSICIPIQSGDEKVLMNMGRKYTADAVMNTVIELKHKHPNVLFSTHIMVGFPGETHEQFQKTLECVKIGVFDFLRYSMYTDRPNTAASKMEGKVSYMQKIQRINILRQVEKEVQIKKSKYEIEQNIRLIQRKIEEIIDGVQ